MTGAAGGAGYAVWLVGGEASREGWMERQPFGGIERPPAGGAPTVHRVCSWITGP